MAKAKKLSEGATLRIKTVKRTKSPRTKPNRPKRKPYRGQGKP